MLKKLKRSTLSGLKRLGVFTLARNSKWRRRRLLIISYHGISLDDEHRWNPALFMEPDYFRARMELLYISGCAALPLDEAIRRLYTNDLPENSVALTFDYGYYSFYKLAYPVLKDFGFPATVYLKTSYVQHNRPIFDDVCPYLLWKGKRKTLNLKALTGEDGKFDLSRPGARVAARDHLIGFARQRELPAEERDALAARLAQQVEVDYDALYARRMLSLLNPEEVGQLAAEGVDIQIVSATTCDPGLASRKSNPLLLPGLVDTMRLSFIEFEWWLTGVSAAIPRRRKTCNRGARGSEMRPDVSARG